MFSDYRRLGRSSWLFVPAIGERAVVAVLPVLMNKVTVQLPQEPVRACDIEPGAVILMEGHPWILMNDFNTGMRRFDQTHRFINLTNGILHHMNAGARVKPLYPGSLITLIVESVLAGLRERE